MMDFNRGLEIRHDQNTGASIYMVIAEPGVYYTAHGTEVSPEIARAAGFGVDIHLKEKRKREAMTTAQRAIEAQYNAGEAKSDVKAERRGYKLVDIGIDRFCILDPDGVNLTPKYMGPAIALHVFDQMVPPEAEAVD